MNSKLKIRDSTRLSLTIQYVTKTKHPPARAQFRRWAKAALSRDAVVTLRIVDLAEGRRLNREYRGKDYATDVLTFVYDDVGPLAGDIVLCAPVVNREARARRKSVEAHYAHLTVHGLLHLQGYGHENQADAAVMEALESAIVTRLGYPNPYERKARSVKREK